MRNVRDVGEVGDTFRRNDVAKIGGLLRKIGGVVSDVVKSDLTVGQEATTGDGKGRAVVRRRFLNELIEILIVSLRRFRRDVPFDVGFATVVDDGGNRERQGFKLFGSLTDKVGFAVAANRGQRVRIDVGVSNSQRDVFREEYRRGRGVSEFCARFLRAAGSIDDVTARAVGERAEERRIDVGAYAKRADRNASVDEFFDGRFKDFFVERRARAHASSDKDDGPVGGFVVIKRIDGDGEGFL